MPKIKVGTKVIHTSMNKLGVVKSAWYDGEGRRYLVRHSGWDWSVPERHLKFPHTPNKLGLADVFKGVCRTRIDH